MKKYTSIIYSIYKLWRCSVWLYGMTQQSKDKEPGLNVSFYCIFMVLGPLQNLYVQPTPISMLALLKKKGNVKVVTHRWKKRSHVLLSIWLFWQWNKTKLDKCHEPRSGGGGGVSQQQVLVWRIKFCCCCIRKMKDQ